MNKLKTKKIFLTINQTDKKQFVEKKTKQGINLI